jgi:hypothetical protein
MGRASIHKISPFFPHFGDIDFFRAPGDAVKKVLDGEETFPYNTYCVLLKNEEVSCHENDVSAQESL